MISAGDLLAAMRALPLVTPEALIPSGRLLVLAPHPDDESLGCGGLIARLSDAGRPPAIVFVTDGAKSHPGSAAYPPDTLRRAREIEALAAAGALGVGPERVRFLRLPDGAAPRSGPAFEAAMSSIGQFAASLDCSTVLSSWRHDPHCDHQATASMARASRLRVLFYPVWGWLLPNDTVLDAEPSGVRISVAGVLDRKRRAIAMHRTQTGLITDDPNGFSLPQALLDACLTPFEVFLEEPA